jgi:hypothetical protein
MNNLKQRKRLTTIGLAFLVVLLAGSAFAFLPGMLDVVGRVGIREGEYVRWVFAATQGTAARVSGDDGVAVADITAPGAIRHGFTHDLLTPAQRVEHGATEVISALPTGGEIYLSHAHIVEETRGRYSQRIEWSVVFDGAETATLYVQAMNYNENLAAIIENARIVSLSAAPVGDLAAVHGGFNEAAFDIAGNDWSGANFSSAQLNEMDRFSVGGSYASLNGMLAANDEDLQNPASSTDIETITVTWDGTLFDLLAVGRTFYGWQDELDADNNIIGGEWVALADGMTHPDFFEELMEQFDFFMATSDADGDPILFDALEPWIGTFILEFDYSIYAP